MACVHNCLINRNFGSSGVIVGGGVQNPTGKNSDMAQVSAKLSVTAKIKFHVHYHLKYMFQKVFKITWVKLTIGILLLIGIYWYQSTSRRFINTHMSIHSHKGSLTIGYYQIRVNTFSEFISNITGTSRELLPNNATHFSRHQSVLIFSESDRRTIRQTFPDFISLSNNTDIFRELLVNNTTHFSRVDIKQYWHFQRVPSKVNYGKNLTENSPKKVRKVSIHNWNR